MGRRLFVGNLPYGVTDAELNDAFSESGVVRNAKVITDRETGQSRGFGFVEFSTEDEAARATEDWNGRELGGRRLTVNEAQERPRRDERSAPPPDNGSRRQGRRKGRRRDDRGYDW
jgi:cold-inducible RNA-binding protein